MKVNGKKEIWKKVVLWAAAIFLFYQGAKDYSFLEKENAAVVALYGNYPGQTTAKEIQKECDQEETARKVCFVFDGGIQNVENSAYGKQTKAQITGLLGNAELYDRAGISLPEEDTEGCIIDQNTAEDLFGNKSCVGNLLQTGGKTYEVRKVMDLSQHVVLIRKTGTEISYNQVLIGLKNGETKERATSQFLMRYGLSGTLVEDDWLDLIVPWFLILFLLAAGRRMGKEIKERMGQQEFKESQENEKRWEKILYLAVKTGLEVLVIAGTFFLVTKYFFYSSEWLPDKWSDFSFWTTKLGKEAENLRWYLMLPKTAVQAERVSRGVLCIGKCLIGILLLK